MSVRKGTGQAWEARDGTLHRTFDQCSHHNMLIDFNDAVKLFPRGSWNHDGTVSPEKLLSWLTQFAGPIQEYLESLDQ